MARTTLGLGYRILHPANEADVCLVTGVDCSTRTTDRAASRRSLGHNVAQ